MMERPAPRGIALLLFLAASSAGCCELGSLFGRDPLGPPPLAPPRAFRDVHIEVGRVRRIVVLPLIDESAHGAEAAVVTAALQDEIAKLRRFEVLPADASDAMSKAEDAPQRTGRVPIATIIDLGRRYGVDAVLFGRITHYRPYAPPALGLSVALVDVETGNVVWAVQDFVDAADRAAAQAIEAAFDEDVARGESVYGAQIMSDSPQAFARFAARRVAATL